MIFAKRSNAIQIKSARELDGMRRAGRLASRCLEEILREVRPGVTTQDLDDLQVQFCRDHGVKAAPLGYRGFPKSICTSVNEVICHGIPSRDHRLAEGDIIGVDVTLIVDGFHGDNAATVAVGEVDESAARLLRATVESLRKAIEAVRPGGHLGDIGAAIQAHAEPLGYAVVRDFVGHGIGRKFHEEPQVSHVGRAGRGPRLLPGMTFTIEPMINAGTWECHVLDDGWTAVTADGQLSAQFEHTIAVTRDGVELLTVQNDSGTWEVPGRYALPCSPPLC
ncbi:MAG: type I methionyl aminopeptidase [Deltaproteobacteria bacterium]|nr:MAG: type I methionyl aminopeptidase [Deltaproteobacteria bacterium]